MQMLPNIEIKDMYNQVNKKNTFGLDSYMMPHQYADPAADMRERDLQAELKKGNRCSNILGGAKARDKNRVDKNYMDFIVAKQKNKPAPNAYNVEQPFCIPAPKDIKAINFKDKANLPSRKTYVDDIFKYNKLPGPCNYEPSPSQFQELTKEQQGKYELQNKRYEERKHFLVDTEYIGVDQPGVGAYNLKPMLNPNNRQSVKEIDRNLYKEIEAKHNALVKSHQVPPSSCTYNTIPLYDTFEKKLQNLAKKGNDKAKYNKDMPQQIRFAHYEPAGKSKSLQVKTMPQPGPGSYNLSINWPCKPGMEPKGQKPGDKQRSWANSITKGVSKSIYY